MKATLITNDVIELNKRLIKAKEALKLASEIMDYCGGDAWEREATAEDRGKFEKLYDEVMGEQSNAK